MRETILRCVSDTRNTDGGDYTQPERLRKQADNKARFYDIRCEGYIQSLIVMVPAWKYELV